MLLVTHRSPSSLKVGILQLWSILMLLTSCLISTCLGVLGFCLKLQQFTSDFAHPASSWGISGAAKYSVPTCRIFVECQVGRAKIAFAFSVIPVWSSNLKGWFLCSVGTSAASNNASLVIIVGLRAVRQQPALKSTAVEVFCVNVSLEGWNSWKEQRPSSESESLSFLPSPVLSWTEWWCPLLLGLWSRVLSLGTTHGKYSWESYKCIYGVGNDIVAHWGIPQRFLCPFV